MAEHERPFEQTVLQHAEGLPLRQEDPVSLLLIIKTLIVLALLLGTLYVVLRVYSRWRNGPGATQVATAHLQCVASLRLSGRTRAYLLQTASGEVLVTEGPSGVVVTPLSADSAARESA